ATYLLEAKRDDDPLKARDLVANFHWGNGALLRAIRPFAYEGGAGEESSVRRCAGWANALGVMVNHEYDLRCLKKNQDNYRLYGKTTVAPAIMALKRPLPWIAQSAPPAPLACV